MNPLITIIVVCYNHSKYVVDCLESIKNQTFKNIQLIVIDDCSTDNSVQIISNWLKLYNFKAQAIFRSENIGLIKNLNDCFSYIKGDFIRLISADDYLHVESCEKSISKLLELGNDYGLVFSNVYTVNDKNEINPKGRDFNKYGLLDKDKLKIELLKSNIICAPTAVMTREAFFTTGNYPENLIIEDYYKWLSISKKFNIAYLSEKLAFYRNHDSNISIKKEKRILEEDLILKIKFDDYGMNRYELEDRIRYFYYRKNLTERIKLAYKSYNFKNRLLSFCINKNVPFLFYRVFKKILNK